MLLVCLFFFVTDFAGNCACRSNLVHPQTIEQDEEKENFSNIKRRHIESVVNQLPLGKIIILHKRTRSVDYAKYNIDPADCKIFREIVKRRYEENEDEIAQLISDSAERYRRAVLAPHVRIINLRRNRRASLPDDMPLPTVSRASRSESPISLDAALD
jgi:hypothetical protein